MGVGPCWPGPFSQEPVPSPAETRGLPSAVLLGRPQRGAQTPQPGWAPPHPTRYLPPHPQLTLSRVVFSLARETVHLAKFPLVHMVFFFPGSSSSPAAPSVPNVSVPSQDWPGASSSRPFCFPPSQHNRAAWSLLFFSLNLTSHWTLLRCRGGEEALGGRVTVEWHRAPCSDGLGVSGLMLCCHHPEAVDLSLTRASQVR